MPPTDPMTPQPCRDPRVDPKPGDVLVLGNNRIEVTERTARRVLYTLKPSKSGALHCGLYLSRWQMVVENAEVLSAIGIIDESTTNVPKVDSDKGTRNPVPFGAHRDAAHRRANAEAEFMLSDSPKWENSGYDPKDDYRK